MFAGKTSELLKRILWAKHQNKKIIVLKPDVKLYEEIFISLIVLLSPVMDIKPLLAVSEVKNVDEDPAPLIVIFDLVKLSECSV